MGVFIYSPGVRVWIDSSRHGLIDITDDLSQGSVTLRESNKSNFNFTVLNHARKYDRVFAPNDRIHVQMKRIGAFLPTFSGYLDQVPYFTTYSRSVLLSATCTLKRVIYTVWDAGSDAAQDLYPGHLGDKADVALDGGLKEMALLLLEKVAGWPRDHVHIGEIPSEWMRTIEDVRLKVTPILDREAPNIPGPASAGGGGGGVVGTSGAGGAGAIPFQDIMGYWLAAGGPPEVAHIAAAITDPESSRQPGEIQPGEPYATTGWGLWQITPGNSVPDAGIDYELLSPYRNAKAAVAKYRGAGNSFRPWTTYTSGKYQRSVPPSPPTPTKITADPGQFVAIGTAPAGTHNAPSPQSHGTPAPNAAAGSPNVGQPPQPGDKTNSSFVRLCLAQKGDQYIYASTPNPSDPDPKSFDCSSLVQWAAHRLGVDLPRTSGEQFRACQAISVAEAFKTPGALLFRGPDEHVAVSLGDGQNTIEARGAKFGVNTFGVAGRQWDVAAKIPGLDYGGGPVPGGVDATTGGPGEMGGGALFNARNWQGNIDPESEILSGHRALMNDQSLMPTIDMIMNASMRSYMSGPNGDFIAWFPDYFGLYKTAGVMVVEDIELQGEGFSVAWNDTPLVTHQFTAGAQTGQSFSSAPGEAVDALQKYSTEGVVTVEFPEILSAIINARPDDPDAADWLDANKILQRFGVRVDFKPMENINQGPAEFWYAMFLFQQAWAAQFMTQVDLTFMPEVYPGMLLRLPGFGVQVYVRAVTHSFDFAGGGFNTRVEVMAPSATDGSGLWGMVRSAAL